MFVNSSVARPLLLRAAALAACVLTSSIHAQAADGPLAGEGLAGQDLAGLGPAARAAAEGLLTEFGGELDVQVDPRTGAVRRLRGDAGALATLEPTARRHALGLAEDFLARHGNVFGLADMQGTLVLQDAFDSRGARHARYRQTVAGVEVVGAFLHLHFTLGGRLFAADSTLSTFAPQGGWTIDPADALAAVRQSVKVGGRLKDAQDRVTRKWISSIAGVLRPVWEVETSSRWPLASIQAWVDATNGSVLDTHDRLCTATGSGLVFDPNPVVVLQDPTLTDMGDQCYPRMMTARSSVVLENLDGSGRLTGTYVSTSASAVPRANEPSLVFDYCRDTPFFSEVMVYYHLDTLQQWIQSLGFNNINNRQQIVDPYESCGAPNAYYNPGNQQITFCRDDIDASEDADVILHEYGHSIQDNQVPGWGLCAETGAMGEGFGDYIAESASSRGPGSFQYGDLGDWFGVQTGGSGVGTGLRTVLSNKVYPQDWVGEVHEDGEIWAAGLWEIWESLGRTVTDSLVLESHFYLSPAADFMDGGEAIMQADQTLYGGAHAAVIEAGLRAHGLYFPEDSFEPNDTQATAAQLACGANLNLVIASGDTDWYTFDVGTNGGWLTFYHRAVSPSGSTTCIVPYDLTVFNPSSVQVPTQPTGGTNERCDLTSAAPGTYFVRVRGNSGARFAYDLDYVEVNDGMSGFAGTCGDCNSDGFVNIIDALTAAQAGAGISVPPNPDACDVDSGGTVTVIDALILAQYAAGLPVALTCAGGACGQGTARAIDCGQMIADSLAVSTAPAGFAIGVPGASHFYRLAGIPPGTSSISISTTGTGDMDLLVARPGSVPGSTNLNRYPTSGDMRSTGPTSTENVTLNAGTVYSPADWRGGPLTFVITSFTAGNYTVTVNCF